MPPQRPPPNVGRCPAENELNDVDDYVAQIKALLKKASDKDRSSAGLDSKQRLAREATSLLERAETGAESAGLEMRNLGSEPDLQRTLQMRHAAAGEECRALRSELEWVKMEIVRIAETQLSKQQKSTKGQQKQRDALFATAAADLSQVDVAALQPQQLLRLGDDIQQKTSQSLTRTKKMAAEAEEIGVQIVNRLEQQENQMERIHEDLTDVQFHTKQARKVLGQLARNVASDRCIQALCGIITISVVVMIVLAAIDQDGGAFYVPDQVRQFDNVV